MAFFSAPGQMNLLMVPQYEPSPQHLAASGMGIPFFTVSPTLLLLSMWYLCFPLCRSSSLSPELLVKKNCSISRYRFGVSVEEVNSGSSYIPIQFPLLFFLLNFIFAFYFSLTSRRKPSNICIRIALKQWINLEIIDIF